MKVFVLLVLHKNPVYFYQPDFFLFNGIKIHYNKNIEGEWFVLGTIVNACAILVGSLIGSTVKKGIKKEYQECLFTAMGLAATGIGINSIVQNMPKSQAPVLFIVSLAVGSFLGTMLDINKRFQDLTEKYSKGNLGQGLSMAILLFCIGTLSILGPIDSALSRDYTLLFTNAALDFVTSMVLASTYGIGIAIAAPILFCWQGFIYLSAGALSGFLTEDLMTEISVIGGFLIASSGITILKMKDCKTLNMLPSLFVPMIWFGLKGMLGV